MHCIVFIHLYSASCSAHQSEALPVRGTQREESSFSSSVFLIGIQGLNNLSLSDIQKRLKPTMKDYPWFSQGLLSSKHFSAKIFIPGRT